MPASVSRPAYSNPLRRRFKPDFFANLPTAPAVYFMRSARQEILYIGRAKNLRARLISYRHAQLGTVGDNIIDLLARVRHIDWELHPTAELAATRERVLIRALVPPYNVADSWQEDYFFIGLQTPRRGQLRLRLTGQEEDAGEFELHGCYPHRRLVKTAYSALLRLLYAAHASGGRFRFPARLCRGAPAYDETLSLPNALRWKRLLSAFLHGQNQTVLSLLTETLLSNETLPVFVRAGLQRDIDLLLKFAATCPQNTRGGYLTQAELRRVVQATVVRRA